jgi:flotillin
MILYASLGGVLALAFVFFVVVALCYRTVVSTNHVHIVQSSKKTVSFGKDQQSGNVYYAWPSWLPIIGVKTIVLPVSVFDVPLSNYSAYDKERVPFTVDVMAFFRITDSNMAAQRVHSFDDLQKQLQAVLQGSIRTILASVPIEEILEGRSKFGNMFTTEVDSNLKEWGVQTVKMIELMDIRDAKDSNVIENIMAKKKSHIEMQSRVEVANNKRQAQEAEIAAEREVAIKRQTAEREVGIQTAEKERAVGEAREMAQQAIKEQAKVTAQRDMAVKQVQEVRAAEIAREVQVVAAEQEKQTAIIRADGEKQQTITIAQGSLEAQKLHAEGIKAEGEAKGSAEQAILMAPVATQIALAKEIGENQGYQNYLISVKKIEASQLVGMEQAKALVAADVKIISNAGNPVDGANTVMDLFTPKGGLQIGTMLEALGTTDVGQRIIGALSSDRAVVEPATKSNSTGAH